MWYKHGHHTTDVCTPTYIPTFNTTPLTHRIMYICTGTHAHPVHGINGGQDRDTAQYTITLQYSNVPLLLTGGGVPGGGSETGFLPVLLSFPLLVFLVSTLPGEHKTEKKRR